MTREDTKAGDCAISLVRALSVPLVGLIFALILVFTRILMASSVPGAKLNFPEPPFGPGFQLGIRTIALVFGLSCAPGLLVGIISGHTIAHNNRLTLAFLSLLRIWQWAPIIIWWVLIHLIFFEFNQSPGRFSYILMIGVPAIAMSSCYHYLLLTNRLRTDWRTGVADATRVAVLRAFLVSIVMALSIWMEPWFAYVETDQKSRHYLTVLILSFLLAIIHWNYRSGLQHSRELYRKLLLTDRLTYGKESFWLAGLIFAAITALWQSLYGIGTLKVSASSIVIATLGLIQTGEIWKDMWVSLQAIMVGITGVGTLAMGVARLIERDHIRTRWILTILSLTFASPMILIPALDMTFTSLAQFPIKFFIWHCITVGVLSFYPFMEALWTLRREPFLVRIPIAIDRTLPYGFTAIIFAELFASTAGWGFAQTVAGATSESAKGLANSLVSIVLLAILSHILRKLPAWTCFFPDSPTT